MPEPLPFFRRVKAASADLRITMSARSGLSSPNNCSGRRPAIGHIALTLKFSCQANFTRAFREARVRRLLSPAQRWQIAPNRSNK